MTRQRIVLPKGLLACNKCHYQFLFPGGSPEAACKSFRSQFSDWAFRSGTQFPLDCKHVVSCFVSVHSRRGGYNYEKNSTKVWDESDPEVFAKYEFNQRMDVLAKLRKRADELEVVTADRRYNMAQFQGLTALLRCIRFVLSGESVVWCPKPSEEHAGEIKRSAGKLSVAWDISPLVGNMRQTTDECALLIGGRQKPYWVPCSEVFADSSEQADAFSERLGESLKRR